LNQKSALCLVALLQALGVVSGLGLANFINPDFQGDLDYARANFDSNLENQVTWNYVSWLPVGYLPCFLPTLYLMLKTNWRYPNIEPEKLRRLVGVLALLAGAFMLCGGQNLFGGMAIRDIDVLNFLVTPVALALFFVGSGGIFIFQVMPKRLNRWIIFVLGVAMIVLALVYLEFLLTWSYRKY